MPTSLWLGGVSPTTAAAAATTRWNRRRAESLHNERRFDHSQIALLRAELDAMRSRLDSVPKPAKPVDRAEVEVRMRELESELDTMSRSEEGLRRLVAIRQRSVARRYIRRDIAPRPNVSHREPPPVSHHTSARRGRPHRP